MPSELSSEQLTRALENVAQSTVSACHPGPRRDLQEPLEQLASQAHNRGRALPSPAPAVHQNSRENQSYYTSNYVPRRNDASDDRCSTEGKPGGGTGKDKESWKAKCPMCSWETNPTFEPAAVSGLAALLEVHIKYTHSNSKQSEELGENSRESEEFKAATTPQIIPEMIDD